MHSIVLVDVILEDGERGETFGSTYSTLVGSGETLKDACLRTLKEQLIPAMLKAGDKPTVFDMFVGDVESATTDKEIAAAFMKWEYILVDLPVTNCPKKD